MDTNHPIPQDVTGFQFRLIGNMTVKQFAFLAVGCVSAFIIYYLPIFILLKVVFIPLFAGTGFAFAFIPVEGRPMDAMVGYFIKALLSPNQYVFHKTMGHFSFDTVSAPAPVPVHLPVAVQKKAHPKADSLSKQKQLQAYLKQMGHPSSAPSDKKEEQFLSSVLSEATIQQPAVIMPTPVHSQPVLVLPPQEEIDDTEDKEEEQHVEEAKTPSEETATEKSSSHTPTMETGISMTINNPVQVDSIIDEGKEKELKEKEKSLKEEEMEAQKKAEEAEKKKTEEEAKLKEEQEKVSSMQQEAEKAVSDNQMTHAKLLELEKSFQEMLSQKQNLEQELQKLKTQMTQPQSIQTFTPSKAQDAPKQQTKLVQQVPQDQAAKKGLPPMPDVPNIFLGVVKDSSGNILPNILVEVKDSEGNPVRAFKTNQLGQFASATPLMQGSYTVEFEDPTGKNKFDAVELEAKGEILLPVEVISHDLREELRKQLFN